MNTTSADEQCQRCFSKPLAKHRQPDLTQIPAQKHHTVVVKSSEKLDTNNNPHKLKLQERIH
jgi:hypothetical protein